MRPLPNVCSKLLKIEPRRYVSPKVDFVQLVPSSYREGRLQQTSSLFIRAAHLGNVSESSSDTESTNQTPLADSRTDVRFDAGPRIDHEE